MWRASPVRGHFSRLPDPRQMDSMMSATRLFSMIGPQLLTDVQSGSTPKSGFVHKLLPTLQCHSGRVMR